MYNAIALDVFIHHFFFYSTMYSTLHEGWQKLLVNFFFEIKQYTLLHVHVQCMQAQAPGVVFFKNKNEFSVIYRQEIPLHYTISDNKKHSSGSYQ